MAAFHAAMAFIVAKTGQSPKTHNGARSEFGRLARDEPLISRDQVSLLDGPMNLKTSLIMVRNKPYPRSKQRGPSTRQPN